jgi:site-specific DNA-methyltransferase (adenine-specific)
MALYDAFRTPYLEGIAETVNNLLAGSIGQALPAETKSRLLLSLQAIRETEYPKEEIRKAMQLAILKGFKHIHRPNGDITPDTIGLLVAFLLEKLVPKAEKLTLLDPLVGTGNLLLTVANNLQKTVIPAGVDRDIESYRLAEAMFDMMQYPENLYFQDTFTFKNFTADGIVTDFPTSVSMDGKYFPYEIIKFHHANLREGGYFVGVIANDFFEVEGNAQFHELIRSLYQVIGLVKLPGTMFKALGKSLLILQKRGEGVLPVRKVLLAEIPSFQDPNAVNEAIGRMDAWFKENIEKKEEEN